LIWRARLLRRSPVLSRSTTVMISSRAPRDRPEPVGVAWIGLSLHHLLAPAGPAPGMGRDKGGCPRQPFSRERRPGGIHWAAKPGSVRFGSCVHGGDGPLSDVLFSCLSESKGRWPIGRLMQRIHNWKELLLCHPPGKRRYIHIDLLFSTHFAAK
jgi:hypothetical protein